MARAITQALHSRSRWSFPMSFSSLAAAQPSPTWQGYYKAPA